MAQTILANDLVPLERLHLREVLQELWRLQVRQITLLSLAMYDDLDAEEPVAAAGQRTVTSHDDALALARTGLEQLEAAMRQLDDGSYGRCASCGSAIGFAALMADPLATACLRCRPPRLGPQTFVTTEAV
jgi:RNA polymerase-binding transcription factor DksA